MFGVIRALEERLDAVEAKNALLECELSTLKSNAEDGIPLRKEIGKAIKALLDGKSDEKACDYYDFRLFNTENDFMTHFKLYISNQTRENVRKNVDLEFNSRINEEFIDAIVERINRKQVG